jgi:hypothetical protein
MRVAGAVAAGYCAFLAMAAAGWALLGKVALGDWNGYQAIYDRGGGYLVNQGRDPLFGWIMDRAFDVLGSGAYETFRFGLFAIFTLIAAIIASCGVFEGSLIFASVLVSVDTFFLKGLVQIREGLAFAAVMLPVALLSAKGTVGITISAIGSVAAAFIHAGTSALLLVWILALCLRSLPIGPSGVRLLPRQLTTIAVASGITIALFINQNAQSLERILRQLGVTADESVTAGTWKYLYWVAMGIIVIIIRAQVTTPHRELRNFRSMYALALGAGLMPLLYVICVITVMTQFRVAAVAAMQIRMLLTAIELSLIIVVVRGRANALTGLVAAATLVDQMRLILVP